MKLTVAGLLLACMAISAKALDVCWRDAYSRGFGEFPKNCPDDQELQTHLCFYKCKPGYSGTALWCFENCKQDERDLLLFCRKGMMMRKKKSYNRGLGNSPKCDPEMDTIPLGICYPYCKEGYTPTGPICWGADEGTPSHPNKCNKFIYGHSQEDCNDLNSILHEAGIEGAECLAALANAILHHETTDLDQCKDLIEGVKYQFSNTTLCSKSR